ncbi:DUF4368 domain-containing protein, partial [uncultured Oscillibacter sp.]|uniref:DUF4368 domain-containing protein n=1 Tax=uncultured Oscillibacter sp. TaxID=876091 RepID=UPI00266F8C89
NYIFSSAFFYILSLAMTDFARSILSSSPHKICDFAGAPKIAEADKPISRMVVHAPDKSSGHRVQRIDVHYTFIGEIDLSPEYSKYEKETAA